MAQKSEQYGINELAERTKKALAMGGPDKIERQHAKGLLTVRERIEKLLDPDTFDELGLLLHSDLADAADKTPADGKVCGFGKVDGRTVMVAGDDVTVKAGAAGRMGVVKTHKWDAVAGQKGYPLIHLGEAGGARLPDIMGSAGMMSMTYPIEGEARDRRVPMIATIMGECYGGPSWIAAISDIVGTTEEAVESDILAPMPGMIIEICVSVGDMVRQFQTVLILEAMKMENQISSIANGKVADIRVKVGDAVKAEQVLMVLE